MHMVGCVGGDLSSCIWLGVWEVIYHASDWAVMNFDRQFNFPPTVVIRYIYESINLNN